MKDKFYIDDWFQLENNMAEYEENGLCDDCLFHDDKTRKLVKCVGWDGIYFCEKHWAAYAHCMKYGPPGEPQISEEDRELIEPFNVSRRHIHQGVEIFQGGPDTHKRSNC